jgi:hypothetical protein
MIGTKVEGQIILMPLFLSQGHQTWTNNIKLFDVIYGATTLCTTTLNIMSLSIMTLSITKRKCDTPHNDTQLNALIACAECHYAE